MPELIDPGRDCPLCPRLTEFRTVNQEIYSGWHNAPVDTWVTPKGDHAVELLIVGLAPGLKGANKTGRPFTGDFAGDLLYETLQKFDLAEGSYEGHEGDTLTLNNCAITNAVRCVPPQNKPTSHEINQCRPFLKNTIDRFENLRAIISLGKISHDSVVRTLGHKLSAYPFKHNSNYEFETIVLHSSYHCSRYNTNTRRLTPEMFENVFETTLKTLRNVKSCVS
ncbi:MAG: uracil-DNA glycosylase [Pseudomonadota bacterium]